MLPVKINYISTLTILRNTYELDHDYNVKENTWCSPYHDIFNTLPEAKEMCTSKPQCSMIYDDGGLNKRFLLCDKGASTTASSSGSRLYVRHKSTYFRKIIYFSL